MNLADKDRTHDWINSKVPVCRRCRHSKISAHIWGDQEWQQFALSCGEELSKEGLEFEKARGTLFPNYKVSQKRIKELEERAK